MAALCVALAGCQPATTGSRAVTSGATVPATDGLSLAAPSRLAIPRPVRRPPPEPNGSDAALVAALVAEGCVLDSPTGEARVRQRAGLSQRALVAGLDRLRAAGMLDGSGTGGVRLTTGACAGR